MALGSLLALLTTLAGNPPAGDDAPIRWGERSLELGHLPPELPESGRRALQAWSAWCGTRGYRLDLDRAGRFLLVSRAASTRVPEQMELALAVIRRFDQELPAPVPRLSAAAPVLAPLANEPPRPVPDHKPLPEDPEEEGDHPWKVEPPRSKPRESTTSAPTRWGSQDAPLDTETVVLFVLHDQPDFEDLLKNLAGEYPFLEEWTRAAPALQGFVLGNPLTGAYLEHPDGVEEWDPDHELVNRLARLCLLRRFGELPNWFVQGYAWHMELALQKSVYCFPWRDEFVWATEHTSWPSLTRERYLKEHVKPQGFLGWKRGAYRDAEAKTSWGVSEYLLARETAKLPLLLDALRVFREEHGRIQDDPSKWRRDVEYEIPLAEQQKLLEQHLGRDYLDRATLFLRQELAH